MYYISSAGTNFESLTNLRERPTTNSKIVGTISTLGLMVEKLDTFENWTLYDDGIKKFWIRNDVHKSAYMKERNIISTKHFYQHNSEYASLFRNDCGQSSMAIVFDYYNVEKTPDEISRDIGVERERFTSFSELIGVAKKYGFDPVYQRPLHIPDIINLINEGKPVVALVNYGQLYSGKNYGHFLVCVGYDDKYIYVQNPDINQPNIPHNFVKFNKALGQDKTTDNMPFQGLYLDNVIAETIPTTLEDISIALQNVVVMINKYIEEN